MHDWSLCGQVTEQVLVQGQQDQQDTAQVLETLGMALATSESGQTCKDWNPSLTCWGSGCTVLHQALVGSARLSRLGWVLTSCSLDLAPLVSLGFGCFQNCQALQIATVDESNAKSCRKRSSEKMTGWLLFVQAFGQ